MSSPTDFSTGNWAADVTGISVGEIEKYKLNSENQVPYTGYLTFEPYVYVPQEIWEVLKEKIEAQSENGYFLTSNSDLNSFTWKGNLDSDNNNNYYERGCDYYDLPSIQIEFGNLWFEIKPRDLIYFDEETSINGKEFCRFLI